MDDSLWSMRFQTLGRKTLRFVYTGVTTVDEAEVFHLLNLAKKYLVGSLSKVVMNYVEECITSENVGQIVLSGHNFLDDAPLR